MTIIFVSCSAYCVRTIKCCFSVCRKLSGWLYHQAYTSYVKIQWTPDITNFCGYFHMWSVCLMVITSSSGDVMSTGEISHFSWKLIGVTLRQVTIELDWYKLKPWIKFSLFLSRYRLCGRRMIWSPRTLVLIWRTRLFQYKEAYKRTCWWCLASDHVSQKHPYRCYFNRCKLSCHH